MFVCICNAIRDIELRQAVRHCQRGMNAEGIYVALGRPPQCRQCIDDAEQIIFEERSTMTLPLGAEMPLSACA